MVARRSLRRRCLAKRAGLGRQRNNCGYEGWTPRLSVGVPPVRRSREAAKAGAGERSRDPATQAEKNRFDHGFGPAEAGYYDRGS
jgi:hypothetical protein